MPKPERPRTSRPELVSPAGSLEAGYAAFQYGADAVYAGLEKFSARADAENLTIDEFERLVGYARSFSPPRRVYAAVNTLVLQKELGELVDVLGALWELGADAAIVQDLGVARIVRRQFPDLALHASTQMAIHNRAGVEELAGLGFARVILARELALDEIRDCASVKGIEVECFVHGALCYSYSGLCLFSSHALGRSGNRGRCAQVCRTAFVPAGASGRHSALEGLPFSMKDLALAGRLAELASAGVRAFKIEGRKRTPLYVAAATDLYRRLLDGTLRSDERVAMEEDLMTVFSRPWTQLYIDGRAREGVTDRCFSGHRGAPAGTVEAVVCRVGAGGAHLRIRTTRRLERFDGLQVELPGMYRPFGFSVERMRLVPGSRRARPREVYEAPAGSVVEVELPKEYPQIPPGTAVYCSSSQEVKRRCRIERPRRSELRARYVLDVRVDISAERLLAVAEVAGPCRRSGPPEVRPERPGGKAAATRALPGPLEPAKNPDAVDAAIREAFARLGGTRFRPGRLEIANPSGLFVPASRLNALRREIVSELEAELDRSLRARLDLAKSEVLPSEPLRPDPASAGLEDLRWSVKVGCAAALSEFAPEDWRGADEAVVDISRDPMDELERRLDELGEAVGRERLRLALPAVTRSWEEPELAARIERLLARGWTLWEAANLAAWRRLAAAGNGLDISADWPLYVTNRQAALQLLETGASRFTLSPEDGIENMRAILAEFGPKAVVIVRQDTPLFISETCPLEAAGDCPGPGREERGCALDGARLVSGYGQRIELVRCRRPSSAAVRSEGPGGCRVTALDERPFSLAKRLGELAAAGAAAVRADFSWRRHTPARVREVWRALRAGKAAEDGHEGNYARGML